MKAKLPVLRHVTRNLVVGIRVALFARFFKVDFLRSIFFFQFPCLSFFRDLFGCNLACVCEVQLRLSVK